MFRLALLIALVNLSNFWVYWIFESNFLLGLLLLTESLGLYLINLQSADKKVIILTSAILIILTCYLLLNHFDKNIFSTSITDTIQKEERHNYYAQEMGRVYKNRVGIFYFNSIEPILNKIGGKFFLYLDFSYYFAPREFASLEKYFPPLAILFVFGLFNILKAGNKMLIVYLTIVLIVTSLTKLDNKLGPILLFPFINLCLTVGLSKIPILNRHLKSK